jgi:hypothetical protein
VIVVRGFRGFYLKHPEILHARVIARVRTGEADASDRPDPGGWTDQVLTARIGAIWSQVKLRFN